MTYGTLSKYQIPSENTLKGYKLLEQPGAGRKHWYVVVTPLLENTTKKAGRRVSLGNSGAGPGLLIVKWKDPDAGKDWRQEEKGVTEDEMVGWRHWLTQWTWVWANSRRWWRTGKPGMLQPIGSESDMTEWLINNHECILFSRKDAQRDGPSVWSVERENCPLTQSLRPVVRG